MRVAGFVSIGLGSEGIRQLGEFFGSQVIIERRDHLHHAAVAHDGARGVLGQFPFDLPRSHGSLRSIARVLLHPMVILDRHPCPLPKHGFLKFGRSITFGPYQFRKFRAGRRAWELIV